MELRVEAEESQLEGKSVVLLIIQVCIRFILSIVIWGGLLFWSAGSVLWSRGWAHLGLWIVMLAVNFFILRKKNPAVLAARTKRQWFEKPFDLILMLFVMLPAMLAFPIISGLDAVRYKFAPLSFWTVYPAVLLHVAGDAIMLWSMAVNPYLEKTIRIQKERGHHVITTGPYAFVRHPMYVGAIMLFVGMPLFLGSGLAFIPVGVLIIVLVIRTVFEDRMLHCELPGYEEYAKKTRYRLLPGVW
ncbi:MAG: isoprenylcysteine carboxylmethyltransferase family protein [Phycisphaerales bacterium]